MYRFVTHKLIYGLIAVVIYFTVGYCRLHLLYIYLLYKLAGGNVLIRFSLSVYWLITVTQKVMG